MRWPERNDKKSTDYEIRCRSANEVGECPQGDSDCGRKLSKGSNRGVMGDLAYLLIVFAFFGLCIALARVIPRI